MANEENDESMVDEIKSDFDEFSRRFDEMKTATLLSEKYDDANARQIVRQSLFVANVKPR